jgi:branched-chain amino acid transport system substrate-binding protein
MSSPQTSVEGINGPAYFDRGHNAILPSRVGQFLQGQLHSLPIQLQEVNTLDQVDLKNLENTGEIIQAEDPTSHQRYVLLKQHVVYAGIDLNKVTTINLSSSTFTADFYLWMRFTGSEDATAITFTTASNVSFDPTAPLKKATIGGLNYRLYHLTGDFKANYDLHEYPFDQQHLTIAFQNARLTNDRLVYVIDEQGLRLRADNTADPTTMAAVFQALSSWTYVSTQYASDTFTSHSTVGDPRNFGQRTQTAYSGLQVTTTLQRKSLSYLIGHLIPLLLLFLLVYASLYLHLDHLGDRLGLIVTSLLASAVLLLSLNGELPAIGYAVSLDYIYYVFFVLCLVCIGITLLMEWFGRNGKRPEMVDRSNVFLHTIYLTTLILTITSYVVIYHDRLA